VAVCGGNEISEAKYTLPLVVDFSPLPSPVLFKILAQGTDLKDDLKIFLTALGQTEIITITKEGMVE